MNAQQLKNAILQEAIEGRLVPQDPNDEPASVLLARIRKEKERLVKEGKLKKKELEVKPISEDEIPFEIPESWEWVRLGEIASYITDGEHKTPRRITNYCGYYLLSARNVFNGYINLDNVDYVDKEEYENISKHCNPHFGDVLISCSGSVGRTAVVKDKNNYVMVRSAAVVSPMYTDSDYLMYTLQSTELQSQIEESSKQTAQANLFQGAIKTLKIPLPPLAEQHRIVAKIEELLPKVEEYGKAQDELNKLNTELPERLKKSILQEAIEGRLVPQNLNDEPASVLLDKIRKEKAQLVKASKLKKKDLIETPITEDEIPFEIPKSWEWVRISDVVDVLMGQSPDGNDVYESSENEDAYEFHQGKICFSERYISKSNKWCKTPSRIADRDSLLVCVRAPIGDVNITQREIGIGRGLASIKGFGNISTIFLFYWMKAHKNNLIDQGTGSTFKAITVEVLKNQPIPLPPLAEQHRIVEKLEQLLGKIDNLKL